MNNQTLLENVKGVGSKTTAAFSMAGLKTVGDLIEFLPRTYSDYENADTIANIRPGKVTIRANIDKISMYRRGRLTITRAILSDENDDKIEAIWFNQPYRAKQLKEVKGEMYFSGDFSLRAGRYQLHQPTCEPVRQLRALGSKLIPIYPMRRGLKNSVVKNIIKNLRSYIEQIPENLPTEIIARANLLSRSTALMEIHFPSKSDRLEMARRRLAFEELYCLILSSRLNRNNINQLTSFTMPFNLNITKQFLASLPFSLTDGQRRASWEIMKDLEKDKPMNRLLQGDVGAGKTVVAAMAIQQAVSAGYQVAMMVPTEVLAKQHYKTLSKLLKPINIKPDILLGSSKAGERRKISQSLLDGTSQLIIGTHALFQESVAFLNLGLVIVDEQHRFGVKQRQSLQLKTSPQTAPHFLSMTATPIPRSLQLTIFGDLDISTIDQLPQGRQKINTKIIMPSQRNWLNQQLLDQLQAGRQVYFVTKLIEEDSQSEKVSAEALYKKITKQFTDYRVGLLHGKLPSEQKDQIMSQFKIGQIDILVATTVIEVGVDVPNASLMVIENADQFGLAQLHQLRGRVGRGKHQSYCYLIQTDTKPPTRRLREIEKSNDGFYLAEVDLKLRGAGEIYGTAQHGDLNLQAASVADSKLIKLAADSAESTIKQLDNNPDYLSKYPELRSIINKYQKITTLH